VVWAELRRWRGQGSAACGPGGAGAWARVGQVGAGVTEGEEWMREREFGTAK